jgi:sec-independent protein translocase protein TatB
MADGARRDLAEGLGPEFGDFDIADLNPRTFVRKHLLDELEADPIVPEPEPPYSTGVPPHSSAVLSPGESPPYDAEAT